MKTPRRTSTPLPNTGSEEQSAPPFPPLSLSSNASNPTSSGFDLWDDSDNDNEPSRISSQSQLSQSQTLEDLSCLNLDESGTKEQVERLEESDDDEWIRDDETFRLPNQQQQQQKQQPSIPQPQLNQSTPDSPSFCSTPASSSTLSSSSKPAPPPHFYLWLTVSTVAVYTALHFLPFLRFFVIRLTRYTSPETSLLSVSLFSLAIGLYLARNRIWATKALYTLSPTKETTLVYQTIAGSFVVAYYIAPRFFMGLHFICNHVPFVGVLLVFSFFLVLGVALFLLMFAAIGLYTKDVTVTLHRGLKQWFGFGVPPKDSSSNGNKVRGSQKLSSRHSSEELYFSNSRRGAGMFGEEGERGRGKTVQRRRSDMSWKQNEYVNKARLGETRLMEELPPSYVGF